jgi:hypothetical protein
MHLMWASVIVESVLPPYLIMSAIVWGLATRSRKALSLTRRRIPQFRIAFEAFCKMTLLIGERPHRWGAFLDMPDFDILVEFMPGDICEAGISVEKGVILWRAAIAVFSVQKFVAWLIREIAERIVAPEVQSRELFENAGKLFLTAVDRDDGDIRRALDVVKGIVKDDLKMVPDPEGLARFVAMLIVSMSGGWKEVFVELFDVEADLSAQQFAFLLGLVRIALFIPEMRDVWPLGLVNVLIRNRDWETAIDVFVAKSGTPICNLS